LATPHQPKFQWRVTAIDAATVQSCRSIRPIGDGNDCGSGVVLNPIGRASAI